MPLLLAIKFSRAFAVFAVLKAFKLKLITSMRMLVLVVMEVLLL